MTQSQREKIVFVIELNKKMKRKTIKNQNDTNILIFKLRIYWRIIITNIQKELNFI